MPLSEMTGCFVVSGKVSKLFVSLSSRSPSSTVDFMSDKPIEIELEGELLVVHGETAPFYVDRLVTVVMKTAGRPAVCLLLTSDYAALIEPTTL